MDREKSRIKKEVEKSGRFPPEPVRDVLHFCSITRLSSAGSTRSSRSCARGVLLRAAGNDQDHERGWASYWHSTMMTQKIRSPRK